MMAVSVLSDLPLQCFPSFLPLLFAITRSLPAGKGFFRLGVEHCPLVSGEKHQAGLPHCQCIYSQWFFMLVWSVNSLTSLATMKIPWSGMSWQLSRPSQPADLIILPSLCYFKFILINLSLKVADNTAPLCLLASNT